MVNAWCTVIQRNRSAKTTAEKKSHLGIKKSSSSESGPFWARSLWKDYLKTLVAKVWKWRSKNYEQSACRIGYCHFWDRREHLVASKPGPDFVGSHSINKTYSILVLKDMFRFTSSCIFLQKSFASCSVNSRFAPLGAALGAGATVTDCPSGSTRLSLWPIFTAQRNFW